MKAKIQKSTVKALAPQDKAFEVLDTEIKGFLLRVQPTGRKTFYYSYRPKGGNKKRIKIGVLDAALTEQQARDKAIILAGQVRDGQDVQKEKQTERKVAKEARNATLGKFIENRYKPWVLANLKSGQESLNNIEYSFKHLKPYALEDINVALIERWRTEKLDEGKLKPATINRRVISLRAILSKAVEWELLDKHPLQRLKQLSIDDNKTARYLSKEEQSRLNTVLAARDEDIKAGRDNANLHRGARHKPLLPSLSACAYGDRLSPLVILSLKTGMRRGELFDIEWLDVDFGHKIVTVKAENAKSGKTRHIPLNDTAIKVLLSWRDQSESLSGRVFPSDNGGRLDNVNKAWRNVLEKAEIIGFRWHDMRHDFASKLVMHGVPLNTVRELCGHADLNTTLRYAHLAPDHKADAVALID